MKEFELETGEHVIAEMRKHWFLFLAELLPFALLAILPFALPLFSYAQPLAPYVERINYAEPLQRVALGIWLLLVWTSAWGVFTRYYLNAWVLTNQRIVNIKQSAFWQREVSSLLLPRVQDVTTDVSGIVRSLLGFGTIKVQTAGEEVGFVMRGIPEPEYMREVILKNVSESSHQNNSGI